MTKVNYEMERIKNIPLYRPILNSEVTDSIHKEILNIKTKFQWALPDKNVLKTPVRFMKSLYRFSSLRVNRHVSQPYKKEARILFPYFDL